MKRTIFVTLFSVGLAAAQTTTRAEYRGQSWVGLLVSASCDGAAKASKASQESNLTVAGRVTTPAVDDAGTRGSSNVAEQTNQPPGEKQTLPETGDILADAKSSTDAGWQSAHKQARQLGKTCSLSSESMRFALMLPNGSLLPFDDLANQEIVKRMAAMPPGATAAKILRVSVQGKLQNGKIALDSIQM